jgi:Zinc carboxypeptidase
MLSLALAAVLSVQDWPQTTAEKSNYEATSTYADVVEFLDQLEKRGAPMKVKWIGESTEGRKIPLCVVSNPPVASAQEARAQGKLVVYIQGNIHAGEVEGKEAALVLLRRIAKDRDPNKWLRKMVLLVNPIYNSDGNEKFGPVERNRPEQDGPKQVGVRANGQNFDLNRDSIKAESPEMRAVLSGIFNPWDPDAVMDLHTTNGTRHGFDLTYAPPLDPNTEPAILAYSRDRLLPDVRKESVQKYGKDLFDYGNASRIGAPRWSSFEPYGRYVTNYAGLCNRIGVLSEATTYIPFKDRIVATDRFVTSVLDHFARNADDIARMRKNLTMPSELGVRFEMAQGREEVVPLEKLAEGEARPLTGRPKVLEGVKMPVFDRFKAVKMAKVPKAYLIPASQIQAVRLLSRHGIEIQKLTKTESYRGQVFTISEMVRANSAFQGHRLIRLEGTFADGAFDGQAGDFLVSAHQKLGRLVFSLLEPEGLDGVAAWEFLGTDLKGEYPIKKVF